MWRSPVALANKEQVDVLPVPGVPVTRRFGRVLVALPCSAVIALLSNKMPFSLPSRSNPNPFWSSQSHRILFYLQKHCNNICNTKWPTLPKTLVSGCLLSMHSIIPSSIIIIWFTAVKVFRGFRKTWHDSELHFSAEAFEFSCCCSRSGWFFCVKKPGSFRDVFVHGCSNRSVAFGTNDCLQLQFQFQSGNATEQTEHAIWCVWSSFPPCVADGNQKATGLEKICGS